MNGNELPRRWNTEEERQEAIAAFEALHDGRMPRAWATNDALLSARQAQMRRVIAQILTGKGLVNTQWAKEASEHNRFDEKEKDIGIA
jgi:hypothetical protein